MTKQDSRARFGGPPLPYWPPMQNMESAGSAMSLDSIHTPLGRSGTAQIFTPLRESSGKFWSKGVRHVQHHPSSQHIQG
jgi:hypothetical protein